MLQQIQIPTPSIKSLLKACLIAVILAVLLLLFAVLPAEYDIDPTGVGSKLGLTDLAKTKQQSTQNCLPTGVENKSVATTVTESGKLSQPAADNNSANWQDNVDIVIPAQKGLEYKFAMKAGALLQYSWTTDNVEAIYFDFHGEPKGATDGYFKSYLETSLNASSGELIAPFEGIHGWYWENKTAVPITIHLHTRGNYDILGVM